MKSSRSKVLFPVAGRALLHYPVAAAFAGLYAERVASEVEAIHYPHRRGAEPDFWDAGGFYNALSVPTGEISRNASYAIAAGVGVGAIAAGINQRTRNKAVRQHAEVTIEDLEKR